MTNNVLVFEGMKVGILDGDLKIGVDESGSINPKVILSAAYNVLPIWLRVGSDQLLQAERVSGAVAARWGRERRNKSRTVGGGTRAIATGFCRLRDRA
jgi:hypothetical protein